MNRFFIILALPAILCVPAMAQLPIDAVDGPKLQEETYQFDALQVKPEYDGGMDAFYKFIANSFEVPDVDVENDFTAKIFANFVIEKDGTISEIMIIRDPGYGLRDEARRIIRLTSGKWSPRIQNGKPIRAMYGLPIVINIPGTKQENEESQPVEKAE